MTLNEALRAYLPYWVTLTASKASMGRGTWRAGTIDGRSRVVMNGVRWSGVCRWIQLLAGDVGVWMPRASMQIRWQSLESAPQHGPQERPSPVTA
jgi:hypothetical protein